MTKLPTPPSIVAEHSAWWTVGFELPWQRQKEPDWYLDTLIAGEILAPILTRSAPKIRYWRFHRRAANDAAGHTFGFIFYSQTQVAKQIFADIKATALLQQLKQQGLIIKVVADDLSKNSKTHIEDTSDHAWPLPIRKTWPIFIQGVSQMWLDLIKELGSDGRIETSMTSKYQRIQAEITTLWQKHGQHAWLHHLNALYGYSPLEIGF